MIKRSLDDFMGLSYHEISYNCSHFVRDLWLHLTGCDISDLVGAWNSGNLATAMVSRKNLILLNQIEEPCIAMFQCPKEVPHVGVIIEGRVFHMTPDGPRLHNLDFVSNQYKSTKFYQCQM